MPDVAVIFVDLGIVAILVGAAVGWNRLRFVRDRSSFACRLTLLGPSWTARRYPRRSPLKTRAKWAGDVLLIQVGPLWARTLRIPVQLPLDTQIQDEARGSIHRLGAHPKSLVIRHEGSATLLIAVRSRDRTQLVGPFLAAAVAGLPQTPRSDRRHRR
jgi:hypothetical protein